MISMDHGYFSFCSSVVAELFCNKHKNYLYIFYIYYIIFIYVIIIKSYEIWYFDSKKKCGRATTL